MADLTTVDGKHYEGVRPQHHTTGVWFSYTFIQQGVEKQNMFFIPYHQIKSIIATSEEHKEITDTDF